jgi:hypothetical protein
VRRRLIDNGWVLLAIGLAGGGVVMYRRAWMISRDLGVPVFSTHTWEEFRIYAVVAGLIVTVRVAWYIATRNRE